MGGCDGAVAEEGWDGRWRDWVGVGAGESDFMDGRMYIYVYRGREIRGAVEAGIWRYAGSMMD